MTDRCFFAGWPNAGRCNGRLVKAHLLPRRLLRREFPYGVVLEDGVWRRLDRTEDAYHLRYRSLLELIEDPRSWVPVCGGLMGDSGHHGQLDRSRRLRIPRGALPVSVELFAAELGLGWWLDREYGQIEQEAA